MAPVRSARDAAAAIASAGMPMLRRSRPSTRCAEVGQRGVRVAERRVVPDPVLVGVVARLGGPGDPERRELADRGVERILQRGTLQAGDERSDQVERALAQNPGRIAAPIALDPSAGRIGGRAVQARAATGGRRRPRRMAVVAHQEGRSIADSRFQERLATGKLGVLPATATDPLIGRGACCRLRQAGGHLARVECVVEENLSPCARQPNEVEMEVVDARE